MGNADSMDATCCSSRDATDAWELRERRLDPSFRIGVDQSLQGGLPMPPSGEYECSFVEGMEQKTASYMLTFLRDGTVRGRVGPSEVPISKLNGSHPDNITGAYNSRDMQIAWGEIFVDPQGVVDQYEVEVIAEMQLLEGQPAYFKGKYIASDGHGGELRFKSKMPVKRS
eukprot:TRINITY_DN101055_c0_g1_i1.p2 TRINITY_DN101055_c0_g1~~TRINITY_DN101055_c0_g1_i1.p2  ORF type:complete len:192 (-),score=30.60 TRINITY_DN101055_c0_g1_i1:215-724(-)